jgi:hypothetical protein
MANVDCCSRRRLYAIIVNNEPQADEIFTTIDEAKAAIVTDVDNGNYEMEDAEVWEMKPILRARKLDVAWDEIHSQ